MHRIECGIVETDLSSIGSPVNLILTKEKKKGLQLIVDSCYTRQDKTGRTEAEGMGGSSVVNLTLIELWIVSTEIQKWILGLKSTQEMSLGLANLLYLVPRDLARI